MVEIFPSATKTPQQALLEVEQKVGEMDYVAIMYVKKDSDMPLLTCSSQTPMQLNFLGAALQHYAISGMHD